jgi:glutamyl-tRNA synthetase
MVAHGKIPEKVSAAVEAAALLNATRHGGKAEAGAVIGRILAEFPEFRKDPSPVASAVQAAVKHVNSLSPEQQAKLLQDRHPEATTPAPREGRRGLPPLPNASKGRTSFRLPPEPSGYMHIGHAMAFTINYLYKEEYEGELWLRFEDTNPRKVARRYYDSFRRDITWLGIKWDREKNVSDDMEIMYAKGEALIRDGKAYACSCDIARVKELRFEGMACEHRDASVERNLKTWNELLSKKHKEGEYVIRFKGDMQNTNLSLRDPNIFRVIDHSHPLTGDRYSLWPTYDVANAIEDELCGVTHVLRSSEFRNELQQMIRDTLGLRRLEVIQFSRFNFKGTPVGKRYLRPLVEEKLVSGWDDPRMPTVQGLERRGIVPETIRNFTLQVGYTKAEHEFDWSLLMSVNRKVLDPKARRFFFVPDPVRLHVSGAPKRSVTIPFHPDKQLGERKFDTDSDFYVPSADIKILNPGDTFRLMDLFNVRLTSAGGRPAAKFAGDEILAGTRKLQWVLDEKNPVKVLVPGLLFDEKEEFNKESLKEVKGLAEPSISKAAVGEIVQFPRFGFCRHDSPSTFILSG